jgi:endonuclease/exonuclease/phosphatase family metal-dependent hydrolase
MNFSVLQWNIWYNEDIHDVANFLKEHPADIVCLQELTINFPNRDIKDTPAFIASQLGYNYYHHEVPIESTEGKPLTLANGIFSRFPITSQRFAWINEPKSGGGAGDEYRAYVEVTLDVDGQPITVATTHSSYTHKLEWTPNKQQEGDRLIGELKKLGERSIFTGDLNSTPDSPLIKAIDGLLQNAGPDNSHKSWTTKPFSYNGFEASGLNWRLDYVFHTKDLKVASSEILTTDFSDHLPILTSFSA